MDTLVEVLYAISTGLLVPVVVALLVLLGWSLLEAGGFLREGRERRRGRPAWERFVAGLRGGPARPEPAQAEAFFAATGYPGLLAVFAARGRPVRRSPLHLGELVSEMEVGASGRLSRMTFGTRVGPILGLMGTLIPMGPALMGLTAGELEKMAANLVVAFSTTVVGLLVGGLCYTMALIRRHWYAADLVGIEYVYRSLHENQPGDPRQDPHPGAEP